jgi:hypothetical protein
MKTLQNKKMLSMFSRALEPLKFHYEFKQFSYYTDWFEFTIQINKRNIICIQRCHPLKEGWQIKEFNKTIYGVKSAIKFAKANI